jgi:glycosyltransferase involved in cell wall biosynthesis
MHHALMIAYFYPPVDHTGTRRVTAFVRYLPMCGYQPVVLTTSTHGTLSDDAERMVYRAANLTDLIRRPYSMLKLRRVQQEQRANAWLISPDNPLVRMQSAWFIPDTHITWYPLALRRARQIVRQVPVQVLYSTSPPETNHMVALRLKQMTGLPWVADFRDGWLFEAPQPHHASSLWRWKLETRLERMVVQHADRIVTVNDVIAGDFAHRYPERASDVVVISNGYDPEAFAHVQRQATRGERFRLVYTGALGWGEQGRSINGLLQALQALQREQSPLMQHLDILLVGRVNSTEQSAIEQSGVGDTFTLTGLVPYQQALQHQVDADVLLLVTGRSVKSVTTTKIFEYLAARRPILALTGPSAAADLLRETEAGIVIDPDDSAAIQATLKHLYERWKNGTLRSEANDLVRQFDRSELTKRLAVLFDTLQKDP